MPRALPAAALVLLLSPGCAELAAVLAPSLPIDLPPPEHEAVVAALQAQGLTLETATDAAVLAASREVLAPLPIDRARVTDGAVEVTIGALSAPVLSQLMTGLGAGGLVGLAGGAAAGGASLLMLILKWRDLQRRAKAQRETTTTTITVDAPAPPETPK